MSPVNLFFNVFVPVGILLTLSSEDRLGPLPALLVAMAIPFTWGIVELVRSRRLESSTVLGVISVALTGAIGVFGLPAELFAVKEALVPLGFAAILLITNRTSFPVVRLLAEAIFRRPAMDRLQHTGETWHAHLVRSGTIWAGIMALSALMKFAMASVLVTAPGNTERFNTQIATYELVQLPTSFLLTGILIMGLLAYLTTGAAAILHDSPAEILRGGNRMARIVARLTPVGRWYARLVGGAV